MKKNHLSIEKLIFHGSEAHPAINTISGEIASFR